MSEKEQWIRSAKAKSLLVEAGKHPAAFQLRQALLIGQVHGRAVRAEITKRRRYGGKDTFDNWDVPPEVWKGTAENSYLDLDTDTYSTGDFGVRIGSVKLWGMSFNKAELIDYFDIEESLPTLASPAATIVGDAAPEPRRGRGVDTEKWGTLIAAVVAFQHSEGLDLSWTASTFHDKLKAFLCERGGKDSDIPHYSKCGNALNRAIWWAAGHEGEPDKI